MFDKKEYQKEWRKKNSDRIKSYRVKRKKTHPLESLQAGRKRRKLHGEKISAWDKAHRNYYKALYHKRRKEVLDYYGGCCACCGETRYVFLAIDHIKGGGGKHIKSLHGGHLDNWLRKNNYPKGFRVLCCNCNHAIGAYGKCPHQTKSMDYWYPVLEKEGISS